MSRPVLTTSRIQLEPLTSVHLPLLVELDTDADVLRLHLGPSAIRAGGEGRLGAHLC